MIGLIHSDEISLGARREVCARCKRPSVPHEITQKGPLCRGCVLDATEIHVHYVIDGTIFSKQIKGRLAAVGAKKTKAPIAVGALTRKEAKIS